MATLVTNPKQHVYELVDRLAPGQVHEAVSLLERLLDPFAAALTAAPADDEVFATTSDAHADVSHDEVLREFGLTAEDFERLADTHPPATSETRPA